MQKRRSERKIRSLRRRTKQVMAIRPMKRQARTMKTSRRYSLKKSRLMSKRSALKKMKMNPSTLTLMIL
jgi:phosphotransacetylase